MHPGQTLAGRYEVHDLVGRGGMGRVFRGTDSVLGRTVALKVLADTLVDDEASVRRILVEARLAAQVRHPNVVQVLDAVVSDSDSPVIVLEYVEGPSLADHLRNRGALPVDEALDVAGEVAAGLAAAHEAGLVHRDVSPANILLDGGSARLTDFGLARSVATSRTLTGTIRGSVAYVAPEQVTGTDVGPAADVYALACVTVAMLTGRPPFEAEEQIGVVHQHLTAPPPDLRGLRPELSMELVAALQAAMAKDPARRIPNAAAFAAAIGRPLRHDDTQVVFMPSTGAGPDAAGHAPGDRVPPPADADVDADATAAFAADQLDEAASSPPPLTAADVAAAGAVIGAASVVSASSVASADVDGSGGSGPLVIIGTTTDPDLPRSWTHRRRVPLPALAVGALAIAVTGVVVGQSLTGSTEVAEADDAASASAVDDPLTAGTAEALEDSLLQVRGVLVDLQTADSLGPEIGAQLDADVDLAMEAAVVADVEGTATAVEALRNRIDQGVAEDLIEPEAEVALLEALLAVEDALDPAG